MTGLTSALTVITTFRGLFPRVLVSSLNPDWSLTVANAASSPYTLRAMTIVALIFVPIVLADHQERRRTLQQTLAERQAARAAIDTASQCRERDLEKDQIMLDLQVLLASLHDWVREHYLAPEGQRLELETATELLYRKAGRVTWGAEQVEIIFEPYRYAEQQRAMEETCRRCNAAQLRWRDGRLLRFRVASDARFQLCGCQSTGQT